MPLVDIQCLGQLARTGTKPLNIFYVAPLSHEAESTLRFNRPDENETISRATLHEHVQHPMNTIIEVDVGRSGSVSFNISTRHSSYLTDSIKCSKWANIFSRCPKGDSFCSIAEDDHSDVKVRSLIYHLIT